VRLVLCASGCSYGGSGYNIAALWTVAFASPLMSVDELVAFVRTRLAGKPSLESVTGGWPRAYKFTNDRGPSDGHSAQYIGDGDPQLVAARNTAWK